MYMYVYVYPICYFFHCKDSAVYISALNKCK